MSNRSTSGGSVPENSVGVQRSVGLWKFLSHQMRCG